MGDWFATPNSTSIRVAIPEGQARFKAKAKDIGRDLTGQKISNAKVAHKMSHKGQIDLCKDSAELAALLEAWREKGPVKENAKHWSKLFPDILAKATKEGWDTADHQPLVDLLEYIGTVLTRFHLQGDKPKPTEPAKG